MLKDEFSKARKKIAETARKTKEIEHMQKANDEAFLRKREEERLAAANLRKQAQSRVKLVDEIKEKRYQMYLNKKKEAEILKEERAKYQEAFITVKSDILKNNQERNMMIRQ